jgi:hypothetical protein
VNGANFAPARRMSTNDTRGARRFAKERVAQKRNFQGAVVGFSIGAVLAILAMFIDLMK